MLGSPITDRNSYRITCQLWSEVSMLGSPTVTDEVRNANRITCREKR